MKKVDHDFNNKSESRKFSVIVEKLYNKTVIDINFGRYKELSTIKSDIQLGLAASVNIIFVGRYILAAKVNITFSGR